MSLVRCLVCFLMLSAFGSQCRAAVIYQLDVSNSFFVGDASFRYTAPTFLTVDTFLSVLDLDFCASTLAPCSAVSFLMNPATDTARHPAVTFVIANSNNQYLYFDYGSFQTLGTHSEVYHFTPSEVATLTITATAPEPSSWALMILSVICGGIYYRTFKPGEGTSSALPRRSSVGAGRC